MRINIGLASTVTATERWFEEIRAGRAFGGASEITSTAGKVPAVQLINPAASGKTILVHRMVISTGVNQTIETYHDDVQRALNGPTKRNLLSGGAAPVGLIRVEDILGPAGTQWHRHLVSANVPTDLFPVWTGELQPGRGITFFGTTVVSKLIGGFFWVEV